MNKELALKRESGNDGQSIFLFYDETYSFYVAFGLSAFYSTWAVDPYLTYSDTLDVPVAIFNKAQLRIMRHSLKKKEHTPNSSYQFQTRSYIGTSGYEKWKNEVKNNHESLV